ncbi:MAG TPA: FKBP-type peptidyl-prolyl cis-trans isomerase [Candidatus Binatia bacterium]|nr:FKBP-type peptidyl-prolyl cis-trans isomerase [Candidatus Binatia bacterium]
MRALVTIAAAVLAAATAFAGSPDPKTDDQKTLYAIGLILSNNLSIFKLTPAELDLVQAGLADGVLGHERKVDLQTYGPKVQEMAQARAAAAAAGEKESGKAFLEKAAKEKGAVKTTSGMVYEEVKAGSGDSPKASDTVKVHYEGRLTDGTVFDSSIKRGEPATFPLSGVIKCWTEGVQLMKVGGKAKLVCPSDLAYGDHGQGNLIPPGATLVFDVELLGIEKPGADAKKP